MELCVCLTGEWVPLDTPAAGLETEIFNASNIAVSEHKTFLYKNTQHLGLAIL